MRSEEHYEYIEYYCKDMNKKINAFCTLSNRYVLNISGHVCNVIRKVFDWPVLLHQRRKKC